MILLLFFPGFFIVSHITVLVSLSEHVLFGVYSAYTGESFFPPTEAFKSKTDKMLLKFSYKNSKNGSRFFCLFCHRGRCCDGEMLRRRHVLSHHRGRLGASSSLDSAESERKRVRANEWATCFFSLILPLVVFTVLRDGFLHFCYFYCSLVCFGSDR